MLRMVESVKSDPNERFSHQNICFEGGGPGFRQQLNNFSSQTKVCLNSPLTSGLDKNLWFFKTERDQTYDSTIQTSVKSNNQILKKIDKPNIPQL